MKNLYYFGLLTSKRLDIQKSIFNYNSDEEKIIINNENTYSNDEYNILDINFTFSDNNEINEINNYIKNSIPTRKNLFTGLLKNKNLIFILAESFNTIAINKEITPNLYKLYNEGFKFTNFYNPLYPVSTADGQYLTDISLFPSDSEHSLIKSNNNYYPYSLANIFNSNNYKSYSYHNYIYNYYERDKYYSNMGFDVYKGIGNGFDNEIVISDYDMLNNSIDEYIDEERFFTYYLTMSGHAPYSSNNKLCINNYEKLSNYNYSDATKYYLSSQIELDKMIGELFDKLEEKNKLEDTVIVLLPDHIPYGLTIDEINEISSIYKDNEFEKYRSSLIIYNNNINKYDESSNYCSNIDVLPTILNLFGIDYDSRLLMGKDILSNNDGIVIFGNRNIITKNYKYSNINEFFIGNINYKEISKIKDETYLKFKISRLILENNYYRFLE